MLELSTISRKRKNNWEYDYSGLGYNYRLPGLNASLGISQLKKLKNIYELRIRFTIIIKNILVVMKYFL